MDGRCGREMSKNVWKENVKETENMQEVSVNGRIVL
jgi:hypothetical protein